jgi:DNA-binding transcriptional ArsR family regulator
LLARFCSPSRSTSWWTLVGASCPDPDIAGLRSFKANSDYITRIVVAIHVEAEYCFGMDIDIAARRLAELGNPTRLRIVRLLVQAGRDGLAIGELQARLGVPASTLAFHLRGLVTAALVEQEKQGRTVRCTIDSRAINATLAFVKENCCAGFSTADLARSRRLIATR